LIRIIVNLASSGQNALDIGARDGHFSKLLTEYFRPVFALDLEKPSIKHKNVECVQGDVTNLDFPDNQFDFVFCAEVLEHIPTNLLEKACFDLSRVSKQYLLIGVPYRCFTGHWQS
jgi:ubiquinone/menaquinone biosynthesis C-methylase UbiE